MTGTEAIQQVLTRVLERNNSPVSQLAAGTGPSAVTITTNNQILTFLNEGASVLSRSPLLQIRGSAAYALATSTKKFDLQGLTTTPSGRVLWNIRSAKIVLTTGGATKVLRVASVNNYDVYYPLGTETGIPQYIFDGASFALVGPTPTSAGAGAMTIEGLLLAKPTAAVGDTIADIPDALLHHYIAFGCWRVCQQNAVNERFAAVLPFWENEITPWAGTLLGLGGGN